MKAIDNQIKEYKEKAENAQQTIDNADGMDGSKEIAEDELKTNNDAIAAFTALKTFIQENYTIDELKGKPLGFEEALPELDVAKLSEKDKKSYDEKLAEIKKHFANIAELNKNDTTIVKIPTGAFEEPEYDLSKLKLGDLQDLINKYSNMNKLAIEKKDERAQKFTQETINALKDYKAFVSAKALEQAEPGFLKKAAVATGGTLLIPLKAAHDIAKYLTGDIAKDIITAGHRTEYLYKDGYSEGGWTGFAKGTLQGAVGTVLNTGTTVINAGSSIVSKVSDMTEDATDRTDNMTDGNKKDIAKGINSGVKLASAVTNLAGGLLDWASYGVSGDYVLGQNEIIENLTNKTIKFLEERKDKTDDEYVNEMRFVTDLCKQLNISKSTLDKMPADQVRDLIKKNYSVIDADILVKNATVLGMKAQYDEAKKLLIVTDATGTAKLKKAGQQALDAGKDALGLVGGTLKEAGESVKAIGEVFTPTGNGLLEDLDNAGKELKDVADMPADIVDTVSNTVEDMVDNIPAVGGGVAKTVDGASNIVTGIAGGVTGLVTGQLSDAGESVVNAGKGVLNVGKGLVNTVTFGTLFGDALDDVKEAAEDAKDYLEDVMEELEDAAEETDLKDKKKDIADATEYAQKAMKAANEALLEAQKIADAAQKDAAEKLSKEAYEDALKALNKVNAARKAVNLPEIPNTLKLQKDIKKTASAAEIKTAAVENSDFVKNIKPELEKRMDKIIESMIPAETLANAANGLAKEQIKNLEKQITANPTDNPKGKKYAILALKASMADSTKKEAIIEEMIKLANNGVIPADENYQELRINAEAKIAELQTANKKTIYEPFAAILMEGFSKFEAKRIAARALNAASFGDNNDTWSWTSFWNAVDHTPAQELNAGDRGFWANLGSTAKGFMMGLPSAVLRDSSLTAWQAASTVPFMEHIGPFNAFFLMGFGSKEHIEGFMDIVNGAYNPAQKASGYENQGYGLFKDIIVWWSHHCNHSPAKAAKPSKQPGCQGSQNPETFDPGLLDPSKIPTIA